MIATPVDWPPGLDLGRRRLSKILRRTYFEVVQAKPAVGFLESEGYGEFTRVFCNGEFHIFEGKCHASDPRLRIEWCAGLEGNGAFNCHLTVDLHASGRPAQGLWESRFQSTGGAEGFQRQLAGELDRLEARVGEFATAINPLIPAWPSIFEQSFPGSGSCPSDYQGMLQWAEGLYSTERQEEAKSLLPVIGSLRPGDGDPRALDFGRKVCLLLSQFPFTRSGIYWNPRWYGPLHVKALELATASISLDPANLSALLDRGWIRNFLQDKEGAVEDYSAVLEVDGRLPEGYWRRASILVQLGEWDAALRDYDRAIGLNGGDDAALDGRASLLHELASVRPQHQTEYLERAVADLKTILSRPNREGRRLRIVQRNLQRFEKDLQESRRG
jgi:tetratricopeptide (TPR) repeat protein